MAQPEPSLAATFAAHCRAGELAHQVDGEGRAVWPPRVGLEWRVGSGAGTVHATTTVRPRDGEPYDVSLIELDEGHRMMSRVEGVPPDEVRIGMRVRVRFADGDPPVPVFVPA